MEPQPQSQIVQLAYTIAANTKKYDDYLSSHGLPSPSFEVKTPLKLELPDDIEKANNAVVEATSELQALMLGPLGSLLDQSREHNNLVGIQAIYRFGIATCFPVDEEASFEQISRACGLDESELRRILRFAMTRHIFKESREGVVAHTAASKALAELPIMRDAVGMICEDMWPSATRTIDAMVKWPGSQEPNHTGFACANNTQHDTFTELGKFPSRSQRFANAMNMNYSIKGFEPGHLLEAFPWDTMGIKVLVDVGGSHGGMSVALAQQIASMSCIVQDLPEVVAEAKIPPELEGRVTFMPHDFFTEQPVKGADVYFFRLIFHNWSDKFSIKILRSLIPALKYGARIIVSDTVLPQPGALSPYQEWTARYMDLVMLEMFNSKERDVSDWINLFKSADQRFEFVGIRKPTKSKLSFIEASWARE